MSHATAVKWLNRLAMIALLMLLYWLFIMAVTQIFGLKVFARSITEAFAISLAGLLALMGGSLMLNVMLNLSRMAHSLEKGQPVQGSLSQGPLPLPAQSQSQRWGWLGLAMFLLSLGLIAAGLFAGDQYTRTQKKNRLMLTAAHLVQERQRALDQALSLPLQPSKSVLDGLSQQLMLLEQTERDVDAIQLLLPTQYRGEAVVIGIDKHQPWQHSGPVEAAANRHPVQGATAEVDVSELLFSTTSEQRHWLDAAFEGRQPAPLYQYEGSRYELFYPVRLGRDWAVLHFSDQQNYGKVSS